MKWVAVFLIIVVAAVACGDVADSENPASLESPNTEIAELEKRIEALEKEIGGFSGSALPPIGGSRIDELEWKMRQIEYELWSMPLLPYPR